MSLPQNKAAVYLTPPPIQPCGSSQHQQKCRGRRKLKVDYMTSSVESIGSNSRVAKKPTFRVNTPGAATTAFRNTFTSQDARDFHLILNLPEVLNSRSLSPERSWKSSTYFERKQDFNVASKSSVSVNNFDVISRLPDRPRLGQARLMVSPKAANCDQKRSPLVFKSQSTFRNAESRGDSDDSGRSRCPSAQSDSADAFGQCARRLLRRSLTTLGPRPPASFPSSLEELSTPSKLKDCAATYYHGGYTAVDLNECLPSIKRQTF